MKILDKGFAYLVEHMGGDRAVTQAARVCYRSEGSKGEEADRKLIAYLMAHEHLTPFEHAVLKFHVKAPIFVARQWFRHRSSAYNEVSARYTEMRDEFYYPDKWRAQDTKNKQGSEGELEFGAHNAILEDHCLESVRRYKLLLDSGVAKELARLVLPVNLYTEWYWTVSARNLMHFLTLRCDAHAQWETRQYAYELAALLREVMPWTFQAWANRTTHLVGYEDLGNYLAGRGS